MTETIRSFTEEGNRRFAEYVESLRSDPTQPVPFDLLTDQSITRELPVDLAISNDPVVTKMELAKRLDESLGDFPQSGASNEMMEGMWNWLSLFFFDSTTNEKETIGEIHRHLLNRIWNRRSRHLVESTYNAYKLHGVFASVILENQPWKGGEVFNNLAGTQEYWVNKALFRSVHALYWDQERGIPKPGITPAQKPGTIRRLIRLFNQLNRTYDLFALEKKDFFELLPEEFERWQSSSQ
jgi:hypothetical protein